MAERLTEEDFAKRLAQELSRPDELVTLVCRTKGKPPRKDVFRAWGEPGARRVTVTTFEEKKQKGQETFPASDLAGRAGAIARDFALWELALTTNELHARRAKKAILVSVGKTREARVASTEHDRARQHVLDPGDPATARLLHALGLASARGNVLPGRERKLRQVEHFVRLVLEVLGDATGDLAIFDAGCGASYLTFALHHVLARRGLGRVTVHGVDVREDVIRVSEEVARSLGVEKDVTFARGLIREANLDAAHVVLSLHACDLATDEALARGVELGASVILAAPCCQHELHKQIESDALAPVLRHGILRERLADLATDALRASILRAVGYKTDVIEFVDPEATAKNLLIRAVAARAPRETRWLDEVERAKELLGIKAPVALEALLAARLARGR